MKYADIFDSRSYLSSLSLYPYLPTRYSVSLEVGLCPTILSITYSKLLSYIEVHGVVEEGVVAFIES